MEKILVQKESLEYGVINEFSGQFLVPIIKNVLQKAETNWDDYDEVYHYNKLVQTVQSSQQMVIDFHFIRKEQVVVGIFMATHGKLEHDLFFTTDTKLFSDSDKVVIFNYVHISPDARGLGRHWLKDIILPFYQKSGFTNAFIKSSHPKVFSLYGELGEKVGDYESNSDNNLHKRYGKIFKIELCRLKTMIIMV